MKFFSRIASLVVCLMGCLSPDERSASDRPRLRGSGLQWHTKQDPERGFCCGWRGVYGMDLVGRALGVSPACGAFWTRWSTSIIWDNSKCRAPG